jgi:hypothetical protein
MTDLTDLMIEIEKMLVESAIATARLEESTQKLYDLLMPKDVGDYDV